MKDEVMKTELLWPLEVTYFDNEGTPTEPTDPGDGDAAATEAAAAAATAAADAAAALEAAGKTTDKTFNQEDVNKIVGERNKALKGKFETMEGNYKELLEQTNLSVSAREKLEHDLAEVQNELMTREQRVEAEKLKAQTKFDTDLSAANESRLYYKDLYESSTIDRAIIDAATDDDAYNGEDFLVHLKPKAKVIEELDVTGEKTGTWVPRIEWVTTNEAGEIEKTLKTPKEAVASMKEMPKHGNLFNSNIAKGVGGGTAPGQASAAGSINQTKISDADYMKLRQDPAAREKMGLPPIRA